MKKGQNLSITLSGDAFLTNLLLRLKAERKLGNRDSKQGNRLTETDALRLLHELEVHQIELEIQGKELRKAIKEVSNANALYDLAPSAYFTTDNNSNIIKLNLTGANLLGLEKPGFTDRPLRQFVVPEDLPLFNDFIDRVFESYSKQNCEVSIKTKDNKTIYVHFDGIISDNEQHCLLTAADISSRKETELELVAAREKTMESDRLKSAFLANMSHEIRTPLNSIIGFSELLVDPDFDTAKHPEFAQMIHSGAKNLLVLINDIIEISKIEAGHVTIKKAVFPANKLIGEIQQEYSFAALNKGIEIRLKQSNLKNEVLIDSDEGKLRQIFVNLIGNAIKFTKAGYVEIGLRQVGDFVQFHVKDTGIGISKEFHDQIFERFQQADPTITRKFGGSGLGLAITKTLVELLGGAIWVQSEVGIGSTFYFLIPSSGKQTAEMPSLAVKQKSTSQHTY